MREFLKMSALSALLSIPAVAVYDQAWSSPSPMPSAKVYQDRLPGGSPVATAAHASSIDTTAASPVATGLKKSDRLAGGRDCAGETWPYIAPACLKDADDAAKSKRVRVITVETRVGPNTSVLSRTSQTDIASR